MDIKIRDNIINILNIFKRLKPKIKSYWTSISSVLGETTSNRPTNADYLDSYEASWLVYTCVRVIAENIAKIPYHLYKLRGNKVAEVKNHPILDLLANPNVGMTQFELFDLTQTYIELTGNAYWLKIRGERSSKIQELQVLRPDWVEIVSSENKLVAGYKYTVGATTITYDAEDIIHFTEPNPKSSFYGLPSIRPALDIISNLVYSTRWNKNFFKNNARPDFWILNKSKLNKEEKEEIKRQMYNEYGGVKNAHKFGIWEGDATIVDMTKTMRDMEFSTLNQEMVNQILGSFGIGKAIIGMQGMNRAEAESQLYSFMSQKIEPKAKRLYDKLNEFLVSEYGDDLLLEFEDPTPDNREATLKEYESGIKNYWLSINEIRDKEGLPAIEGGWDIYMPFNLAPMGDVVNAYKIGTVDDKKYFKIKEDKQQSRLRNKILNGRKTLKVKRKIKSELLDAIVKYQKKAKRLDFTEERKKEIWKQHDYLLNKDERLFKTFIRKLLKSQQQRFLNALNDNYNKDISDLINWDNEEELFFRLSLPVFKDMVERRGKKASELIGLTFQVNPKVLQYLESKSLKFAEYVNATTMKNLKNALKIGIEQGEGISGLSTRVNEVFNRRRKWEAERIARTEVLNAHNNADLLAYEQSGVVTHKEWLATMDDRTRDAHAALNGQVVLLNENFSNGLSVPSEPNCRCTILPVVEDW